MNKVGRNDPCTCGSGKKYKQCCGLREQMHSQPSGAPAQQLTQALQAALGYHQQGRLAEAEPIYRQILGHAPRHPDALHFYGVLLHQSGRHAQALELITQAAALQPADALLHNNLGDVYRALGRGDDALASFQRALALQPGFDEVHNNLGETYRAMGRLEEAGAAFRTALARKPDYAEAHHNLGLVLQAQGHLDEAAACLRQALSLRPRYAKAHYHLGLIDRIAGRRDEAQRAFEQALACRPDYPEALLALAGMFQEQGQLRHALPCCQKALQLQPDDEAGWRQYAEIVKLISSEAAGAIDAALLLRAFRKEQIDPQNLERIAVAQIAADAANRELLASANADSDGARRIEQALIEGRLTALLADPLLLAVLEETVVTSYPLERLLISIRRALLRHTLRADANAHADPDPESAAAIKRFTASLALQCFANEYIYTLTDEEREGAAALAEKIAATLDAGHVCPPLWLLLLACYRPLHRLDFAERLAAIDWPQAEVQAVIVRQLQQPLQEEKIKASIPRATGIDDAVSQAVRQQYEENPYPRWRRRGRVGNGQPVNAGLQQRFPHQAFPSTSPAKPQILVAGCGTGSDAVQVAEAFANADILAVDISLSSLAYAKRATQAFGISNIEFRQADILELAALDRQFDVIACSGVLHHMREPLTGWRVLTGLLRPGGYMNIGLYSRRARHEVTAARRLVAEKGYGSTLDDIRRFRADVMAPHSPLDIGSLAQSPDFYSVSACRDLIFHVQEHLFSPLEIEQHLHELGLTFLGFEFANPEAIRRYRARFPDNPACDVLANWDLLEQEQPQIFAGMYQFWLRKDA